MMNRKTFIKKSASGLMLAYLFSS